MVCVRGIPGHPLTARDDERLAPSHRCSSPRDEPLIPNDRRLLARAVELGRRGWGRVHPNPMVGAVVARDGAVLAEGWHEEFGGPHAEAVSLAKAANPQGATLYVSLEPCAHRGKTPPCTEAIRQAGVARVVYWAADPGRDSGGGGAWLQGHGVEVDGPWGDPGDWAAENPAFFRHHRTRPGAKQPRPFVALKLAASLDGRIAPAGGKRVWLTGEEARREVHRLRAGFGAVMVGTRTWKADDPRLNVRGPVAPRVPPLRVLLDPRGELPANARTLDEGLGPPPLLLAAPGDAPRLQARLGSRAQVVEVPATPGSLRPRLDLAAALHAMARRGVESVLCEGGGRLASALLSTGLADRLYYFVTPVLLGADAVPAFSLNGRPGEPKLPDPAHLLHGWRTRLAPARFGDDTLIVLDRED